MTKISPDTLRSQPWHGFEPGEKPSSSRWVWELVIPLVVIALLWAAKAYVMAGIVAGIAGLIWLARAVSAKARRGVDKALGTFAGWVGQIVGTVLLAPVFFVVMSLVRLISRMTGSDPLQLRCGDAPTFWLPSDLESRRARHVKSMFCTERLTAGRFTLLPLVTLAVVLVVVAEIGLRIYGFGTPVLYTADPDVGYYPKPNQQVRLPGRKVRINNWGMRGADVAPQKAPGHIRILMLGDSTLMGTYVSDNELYSALLEKELNTKAGAPIFEVMNMGVNAWGPFHELAYVKKFGTFQADVAIICGPMADAQRPRYGLERLPFNPATHPPKLALEQILYEMCWRFRERTLGPQDYAYPTNQTALGARAYGDLARYLKQQGVEVVVEMLPQSQHTLGKEPINTGNQRLMELLTQELSEAGVSMNCAGPIFTGAKPLSKVYHDTVHFDRLGHRLYADYLAQRLGLTSSRVKQALEHR